MQLLTNDIGFILFALRGSSVIEVSVSILEISYNLI